MVAAAPPASAAEPLAASVVIGSKCVGGTSPMSPVTVTVARTGARTLSRTVTADPSFQACFSRTVRTGDTITLDDGLLPRTVTVPRLSAVADRSSDKVTGRSGSGALELSFGDCGAGVCMIYKPVPVTVEPNGTFSHPLTLTGSDWATLTLSTGDGDRFQVDAYAATLRAPALKRTTVQVIAAKTGKVTVTVRSANRKLRGSATAVVPADGRFHTLTIRKDGRLVALKPGDRVSASIAPDARITLPSLTVTADGTADTFSATCYPDLGWSLEIQGVGDMTISGASEPSGAVVLPGVDLHTGDKLILQCFTAAGDVVFKTGTVG